MVVGSRTPTAFELFLQRRQTHAEDQEASAVPKAIAPLTENNVKRLQAAHAEEDAAPARVSPPRLRPLQLDQDRRSYARPYTSNSNRPPSQWDVRRSAPDLIPQVVASLPSPRLNSARASPTAADKAAGRSGAAGTTTAVYGELASAAASLASAAQKLATGNTADRAVAASYQTLAQAATDLATSACLIRPLTSGGSSPRGYHHQRQHKALTANGSPNRPPGRPMDLIRSVSMPRAVDPMAAAAAAVAAAAAAAPPLPDPVGVPPPQGPASSYAPSLRPGTGASMGGSRARVAAPRFPGYNPLIHLVESDLPLPGGVGTARPVTSSPITHQLQESRCLPASRGASSTAGSAFSGQRRSSWGPQRPESRSLDSHGALPPLLHPADLSRLPVLSLGPDGSTWRSSAMQGQAGGSGAENGMEGGRRDPMDVTSSEAQLVDPLTFLAPYAELRLPEWPPPEPITVHDMHQDQLDMKYNKLLAALRDRLQARGPARLTAAFRDVDPDGLGLVSRRDFVAVLRALNLGGQGLVDEKVVDLMLDSIDHGDIPGEPSQQQHKHPQPEPARNPQGSVAYSDFVNALRFGSLPWRGYTRKLRHRAGGDPDQPIGPSSMPGPPPYGTAFPGCRQSAAASPSAARAAAGIAAVPGLSLGSDEGADGGGAAGAPSLAAKWADLRDAFRRLDHNADGVVEWGEFREALRRVGEQHRLLLSDQEMLQVYQEADPGLTKGVDYEAFISMYGGGARGAGAAAAALGAEAVAGTAAGGASAGGAVGAGNAAVIPEFFQPKQLRCGDASRPWPWNWGATWQPLDLWQQPPRLPAMLKEQQQQFQQQMGLADAQEQQQQQQKGAMGPAGDGGARSARGVGAGYGAGGDGNGHRAGAAGGGAKGPPGAGAGAGEAASVWWGSSRTEQLRGAHAGAAAVLKRLGSASGAGRAPVRV